MAPFTAEALSRAISEIDLNAIRGEGEEDNKGLRYASAETLKVESHQDACGIQVDGNFEVTGEGVKTPDLPHAPPPTPASPSEPYQSLKPTDMLEVLRKKRHEASAQESPDRAAQSKTENEKVVEEELPEPDLQSQIRRQVLIPRTGIVIS